MDREAKDVNGEEAFQAESGGICQPLLKQNRRERVGRTISNVTSQLAIVGSNVSPVESLDYEIIENDLFKHDWRGRTRIQIFQYIVLKWTLAFLIGLSTGLIGFFINLAVENIAGTKLMITNNLMIEENMRYALAFGVFAGTNLILVTLDIAPAAAGSGIPEVKAYLNGVDAPEILSPRTLIVKVWFN